MSYVKLDTGLLNSTLWIDREAREMFITALLMAVPKVIESTPQLEARSLSETGWIVPAGEYGFVAAAGPGICRQAGLDLTAGLSALERLGEIDPESRSTAFDGRRLVRIDGGYIVLNYMAYRDKDHTAAVRQKRFRERNAVTSQSNAVTPLHNTVTPLRVTEAEAEAEAKQSKPTPSLRSGGRARPGVPIPHGFGISPAVREWARRKGFEPFLELHFEQLVDYAKSGTQDGKPVLAIDWDAKFRRCIADDWGRVRENAQRAAARGNGQPGITKWKPGGEPNHVLKDAAARLQIEPWQPGETHGAFRRRIIAAPGGDELLQPRRQVA